MRRTVRPSLVPPAYLELRSSIRRYLARLAGRSEAMTRTGVSLQAAAHCVSAWSLLTPWCLLLAFTERAATAREACSSRTASTSPEALGRGATSGAMRAAVLHDMLEDTEWTIDDLAGRESIRSSAR